MIAPRRERTTPLLPALVVGFAAVCAVGCSRGAAPGGSAQAARTETLCDRAVLTLADVGGILKDPILSARTVPGDVQSCEFGTAGFPSIIASLRPGRGRSELSAWVTGKLPLAVEPLSGVGESAVWQASLREVIARRNDLLCEIQVRGEMADLAGPAGSLASKAGALCNKLFAVY